MVKILINVFVPAIGERYDILVPEFLRIKNITTLIAESVEQLSDHIYIPSGEECLCDSNKKIILRSNTTLDKYGIQNGDHLVLM